MSKQISAKTLFSRPMNQKQPTFLNDTGDLQNISIVCANKLGVLGRVSLIFSRRGYNIRSLNFKETNDKRFSVIEVAFVGTDRQAKDIIKNLNNLIDTVEVRRLTHNSNALYQERHQTGELNVF